MVSTVSIRGSNYGSQIGANYGSVTNDFHLPWDLDDKLSPVPGAAFDSYVDQHEDQCLSGTRTDVLSQIREWASSPQGRCIFWLNGMAGTGKSTISRTMAKSFSLSKSLGASFFFKRGEGDRGHATKLFPTIARELAKSIPQIKPALEKAVRNESGIAAKAMKEQFERLVLNPLQSLELFDLPAQTMIIVIDALDECEGEKDIRLILQLLPRLQEVEALRLRVFITSRPELPIRLGFSKLAEHDHGDLVLHEIPKETITHDISLFLKWRFTKIRDERQPPLPQDWPGDANFQKLVALSVPLFIFAATVCRIFEDQQWNPTDSLIEILTHQNNQSKLDATYYPILDRLLRGQDEEQKEKLLSEFHQVIGTIVILDSPLSVNALSKLLELPEDLVYRRINPLYSVIRVPDSKAEPVRLFHLSFRDFLLDKKIRKRTPFGVNATEMHYRLAKQCLLICQSLQKNICGLPSDGTERTDIDAQAVDSNLPQELQYACRYWAYHLSKCANSENMKYSALLFLQRHFLRKHFLHWVEAMSLLGLTSEILGILDRLHSAIPGNDSPSISDFLHDAKRFILKNYHIIDLSPLQVYCAGLIFAPQTAVIRAQFKHEIPTWISHVPLVEERWGPELQTLEGHADEVLSVAFSPDGRLLASGSRDKTVRLWDPATGALIHILEGHSGWIRSVVFSPDGRLLLSCSDDKTVRFWDPATGAPTRMLEGHSGWIRSAAFSPDSRLLAFGSREKTVQLWDPATGALTQTLEGHSGLIYSVAFSPDGRLLASGSDDNTVQLWDLATGTLTQTLEGHSGLVGSVAFSFDGRLLASGSDDKTVQLWDLATGTLTQTLEGHSILVGSVAFSSDGRLLASGSFDSTVRLWDPATGTLTQTLKGHLDAVHSVAFSPDGQLLASGSSEKTVRLWDAATDALTQTLEDYSSWDLSMAFLPDGRLLASNSFDRTVRLWDPATGAVTQTLEGHSFNFESAFSPDGRLLVSSSDDKTVRLWDPATGVLTRTLEGHSDRVYSVAFSPDSRLLASGFDDGTVRLWDTATGALTRTLEGHSDRVYSVAFSPDGRLLASGSFDSTVRLWDLATGALTKTLEGHSDRVYSVAFSPDSRLLASGSYETMQLWDVATGALTQTWNAGQMITKVEFSDTGLYLQTHSGVLEIQSRSDNPTHRPPHANLCISIEQNQWIKLNGEKVLWLPFESRPSCSNVKVNSNILALAPLSGRIIFIGFCT